MRLIMTVLWLAVFGGYTVSSGQTVQAPASTASAPVPRPLGMLFPSQATYHVVRVTRTPDLQREDPLADPAWQQAEGLGPFFSNGAPEPLDRTTQVRMLCAQDHLFFAARCLDPQPEKIKAGRDPGSIWTDDSIEVILTEGPDRPFPFVHIQINAAGVCSVVRVLHPFTKFDAVTKFDTRPAQGIDPALLQPRAGRTGQGWWAVFAVPMKELHITQSSLSGNVVRNRPADTSDFAWMDLWSGWFQYQRSFSPITIVDELPPSPPCLRVPVALAVGDNNLSLENWREGYRLLCNGKPVPLSAGGQVALRLARRGPVSLQLVDRSGTPVITYSADVPRPLLVEAATAFQADMNQPIGVNVSLRTARPSPVKVTLEATQDGTVIGSQTIELANGSHVVSLPCRTDKPGEVQIRASVSLSSDSGEAVPLAATHLCVLGTSREALDRFRPGIESLDTRSRYRAAVADACNFYRLLQAGDGQFRSFRRGSGNLQADEENGQMTYAFALVYTADWPENPYRGDKRFLAAAAAGLEAGLSAETWHASLNHPPNWRLQSYLLAYELLRDEVPAEQAEFWRDRLTVLMETTIAMWLRPATYKLSFYSVDVGTGSNHFAYHTANVFTAGRVLHRPDWTELARTLMRRYAFHGREGFFPERRGIPATHYNWLSANALAEYYWQSGDPQVLPTLLRTADFFCHTLLPPGNMMLILHDGRNNDAGAGGQGDSVLSLTPQGRWLARARAARQINDERKPSQAAPSSWLRTAEAAVNAQTGDLEEIPEEFEYSFLEGRALVARRQGFIYGLSALCIPPTITTYEVDAQNALELNHVTLGRILSGANSQQQPEAGSFFRKTKDRTEFLPVEGHVERTDAGHAAVLSFDTFQVRLSCEVLSPAASRITVDLLKAEGDEPILFNFFPVAAGVASLQADSDVTTLNLQDVVIRCSQPVQLQRDFRIVDPYSLSYRITSKPLRAYAPLRVGHPFVLDVTVRESAVSSQPVRDPAVQPSR